MLIARAERNFIGAWTAMAEALPGGAVSTGDGVAVAITGIALAPFNLVFITHPHRSPKKVLRSAIRDIAAAGVPALVRIRSDLGAEIDAAERLGLDDAGDLPVMAMSPIAALAAPPGGLRVDTVADDAGAADHLRVVAESFGLPADQTAPLVSRPVWTLDNFELYVGYEDGRPVATAALCMTAGTAGVYNVAVSPAHRRRGLGEALTAHAIRRGVQHFGADLATLQASEAGAPVYLRMGFTVVSHYRGFVLR